MDVAIVGTGMIGASVGLAARRAGMHVVGWDVDGDALAGARGLGALDEAAASLADACAAAETIVIAAPLRATLTLLGALPPTTAGLVIDVASVKAPVIAAACAIPAFVATHPLAGSERAGPASARADLFDGRVWAYVPPADPRLEERVRALVALLGGRPLPIGAERHDALVGFTSHLPQVASTALGALLARRLEEPALLDLCGTGMASMTRLAGSAWTVWDGILDANAAAVAQEVRAFAGILRSVADAVEARDSRTLREHFAEGAAAAAALAANEPRAGSVIPDTPNERPSRGIL